MVRFSAWQTLVDVRINASGKDLPVNEGHSWFALICFDILSFIVKNTKWMKFVLFLGKSMFYHLYLVLYLIIKLIWVCMFVGGRLQHLRDLGEWFSMYVYRLDCRFWVVFCWFIFDLPIFLFTKYLVQNLTNSKPKPYLHWLPNNIGAVQLHFGSLRQLNFRMGLVIIDHGVGWGP